MFYYDVNIPSDLGYLCEKQYFEEDYLSKLHWHGYIELEFFISGEGMHYISNKQYAIRGGDMWILTTINSHQVALNKGARAINLAFHSELLHEQLNTQLNQHHPLHCRFDENESKLFLEQIEMLCQEHKEKDFLSKVKAISIINDILVNIVRKSTKDIITINNQTIREIVDYLQANYKDDIALVEVAKLYSLTPNYCGYLFKKIMGITFNDYLNILRLKHACKALLDSNLSIKEIAFESGFHSLEYFYATFKKFYGITPAKYKTLSPTQLADIKITKIEMV